MLNWTRLCLMLLAALSARPLAAESQPMNGDWNFYWQQLLTPADITQGRGQLTGKVPVDLEWVLAKIPGVTLKNTGYATYQYTFEATSTAPLTIRFPRVRPAGVLWVNDEEVARLGTVSTEGKEKVAGQRTFFHTFTPRIGSNTVTIAVSNFSYYYHAVFGSASYGDPETVMSEYQASVIRDSVTFGAILIMAFYHFYLWWIRRSRRAPLYFGLFCLAIGLRSLVSGQGQILSLTFPFTPMEPQIKIEYLGISLTFLALILLIHDLYPKEFPRILAYPWSFVSGLWTLAILVTPGTVYPMVLRFFQLSILVAGTMVIMALIVAATRKREGARVFLAGFGIFFATSVTDILGAMDIIKTPPVAHLGTFIVVFFQSVLLSRRFDRAFDQAEKAEKEVRVLNEGLEQKVKERTDQINIILRNVSSGFLLIDRRGILLPGFTDSCHKLIGTQLTAGTPITDMLPIDPKTKSMLRETIVQVFEDFMPTEVSLSQIPHPVAIGPRMLGISGAALRDAAGTIWAILFTITDVTRLQEAEKQVRYNEMLIGIIREQAAFKVFLDDFRKEIQLSMAALQSNNQKAVRNLLHTMKGNLGAFGMRQLAEYVHETEGHESIAMEQINSLSTMMENLLSANKSLLGLDRKDTTFEVLRSDYDSIVNWSSSHLDPRQHYELLHMLRRSTQNSIRSYIGPLQSAAERLGERLDKDLVCEIQGADMPVDDSCSGVLRNLVHLVRNAVDHGIEMPEERGTKKRKGLIRVAFVQTEKHLQILVEDDGRGLNVQAIKAKAKALGIWNGDEQTVTDEDVYRFIFAQGFSTAEEVSDISGRGVGMSAILAAVEELKGTLRIESNPGRGMKVQIEVPLPEVDAVPQKRGAA